MVKGIDIITIGRSAGLAGVRTALYEPDRVQELQQKGFTQEQIEFMIPFELGYAAITGAFTSGIFMKQCQAGGGAVGAAVGSPFGLGGSLGGYVVGSRLGPIACGVMGSNIALKQAQLYTEYYIGQGQNLETIEFEMNPTLNGNDLKPPKGMQESFWNALETSSTVSDPLILDLDGDGLETQSLEKGIYFDANADGFYEKMAWTNADDALLAIDINQNDFIDDGNEIIKTFQDLSAYDSNTDGIIDQNDTKFNDIQVIKGDGTSLTFSEAGIKSINLNYTTTDITDINGNQQIASGNFTWNDDTTGEIGGYNLQSNPTDSIENELLEVPPAVENLPDITGFGNVYSLHQAIVRDTSGNLQTLVQNFIAETDVATRESLLNDIIYPWAGTTSVDPASRGSNIDGRNLATLEKFMGRDFIGVEGTPDPNIFEKAA